MSDFELKVVDTDTGAELGADTEGEVCVRGHLVMQGYYENPEATAAVIDADGWFHTGDLGDFDDARLPRDHRPQVATCSSSAAPTPTRPRSSAR